MTVNNLCKCKIMNLEIGKIFAFPYINFFNRTIKVSKNSL